MPARWSVHATSHEPSSSRKSKVKKEEPFDIDELCRRLEVQLRRQGVQEERRRQRAREKQAKQQQYHHTPQFAALDFARTATPDGFAKKDIHTLSQPVLQRHKEGQGSKAITNPGPLSASKLVHALEVARSDTGTASDRNQFSRTRTLEEAARVDRERHIDKPLQRDFENPSLTVHEETESKTERSFSEGHNVWDHVDGLLPSKPPAKAAYRSEDHPDWAQRDECARDRRRSFKDRVSPLLKRTESIWGMKGKDRSAHEVESNVDVLQPVEEAVAEVDTKRNARGPKSRRKR